MRTQKRFTVELLERYRRLGRGTGIHEAYLPWHRVGRSDPASTGRSHLLMWKGRQRELLSDIELVVFLFASMIPDVYDIREQMPLSLENSTHEMSMYVATQSSAVHTGTIEIAAALGVKHPKVRGNKGQGCDWVMTTDFLLTLRRPDGHVSMLAIAVKPDGAVKHKRTHELLAIEDAYWSSRGVEWLLITPSLYHPLVADTLRNSMPWALSTPLSNPHIGNSIDSVTKLRGTPLSKILKLLSEEVGSKENAQCIFWQLVWLGHITIDLRRGWRPHEPIAFLAEADFWSLNPIASRRSSWPT